MNVQTVLEYSFRQKLGHIASSLSMLDYIDVLFANRIVKTTDHIVLGKPFGAQVYYLVWQEQGFLSDIEKLSVGVKHDEVSFVDYSEETMGNALGVAAGIALTTNDRVWVNISDASLQMGNTLEAIQFIGHNQLSNIFVTVDYNGSQVTGTISDIINVEPCIDFCQQNGWHTTVVDGHDRIALSDAFSSISNTSPSIIFCRTVKGNGVREMVEDPVLWHYKKIDNEQMLWRLAGVQS